jgi:hypothetical protein
MHAKTPGGTDEYAPTKVHAPGSAIYKTTDGGKSFTKLSKGLPSVKVGRIGFDWSRKDAKTVFAIVDTEKAGVGKRAYLGLQSETNRGEGGGVSITSVSGDTPAFRAGLKSQDVISAIGVTEIKTYEAMIQYLQTRRPGEKEKIAITRGKAKKELEIEFGIHPDDIPKLGVSIDTEKPSASDQSSRDSIGRAGLKVTTSSPRWMTQIARSSIWNEHSTRRVLQIGHHTRGKESAVIAVARSRPVLAKAGRWVTDCLWTNANLQRAQGDDGFQTGGVFRVPTAANRGRGSTASTRGHSTSPNPRRSDRRQHALGFSRDLHAAPTAARPSRPTTSIRACTGSNAMG